MRREAGPEAARGASLALDNLRAFVILLVLSFHSSLAYLDFLPKAPFAFDDPPFGWRSFPIIDPQRSVGLEVFCAWQDVFLMSLFMLLSGLFVWPSLQRKGAGGFVHDRALRLGLPFVLVVLFLMPVAHYPTYLQTATDPTVAAYWRHWLALPFWPSGPMWFLWPLLVADLAAAALHRFAPRIGDRLDRLAAAAQRRPARGIAGFLAVSALAYVPLALALTPGQWFQLGPLSLQASRPLHYALYFFTGLALGATGLGRELFAADGTLARHWRGWLAAAVAGFLAWLGLAAATHGGHASLPLQAGADAAFVFACFGSCGCVLAVFLRFARRSSRVLETLRSNAYGMFLLHYLFVVWLQYALLPLALPGAVKALAVFAGTLAASWAATVAIRRIPAAAVIIGAGRRVLPHPS